MADVKWIKIVTDVFDDDKIKLIESMPEADGIIVIWFKLLCMAGKQNNGGVMMLNDKIAYTDEMLATIFRRPLPTVRLALKTFEQFGMIEIVNNTITIPNWEKHQSLDKLEQAKEKNRLRVAAHREKQKALAGGNDYGNVTGITCNDAEEDKDKDKEEDIEKKRVIYSSVIDHLNEKAGTKYRTSSRSTQGHINARIAEGYTLEDFYTVIDKKCTEWKGDPKMEKYLRPETLFGSKFENYLNAPVSKQKQYGANGVAIEQTVVDDLDGIF